LLLILNFLKIKKCEYTGVTAVAPVCSLVFIKLIQKLYLKLVKIVKLGRR